MNTLTSWRHYGGILFVGAALAACGGGGGGGTSSTGTANNTANSTAPSVGYLVDAPVYGVSYKTSSGLSGTTGADGSFSYMPADTVDFSVLGVSLGSAAGNPSMSVPSDGIVTPFNIANETASSSSSSAPKSAAIAAFLQTLANIASGSTAGASASATMLIPTGTIAASLQTSFAQETASGNSTLIETLANNLSTLVGSNYSSLVVTPATAASTAYAFTQAASNSQSSTGKAFANTVWKMTGCTTGSCTLYAVLMSDGTISGINVIKNGKFGGYWNATTSSLTIHLQGGAGTADATLSGGATSGQIALASSDSTGGTANIAEIVSSQGVATVANGGLWYANYTPASTSSGLSPGQGIIVLAPDGTVVGSTSGTATLTGTWSGSAATMSVVDSDGHAQTCSLDLSAMTGTCSGSGQTTGTLVLSRSWLQPPAYTSTTSGGGSQTFNGNWTLECPLCQSGSTTGGSSSGTFTAVLDSKGSITFNNFTVVSSTGANAGNLPNFTTTVNSTGAFTATASAGTDCVNTLVFTLYGQISGDVLSFSVSRPQGTLANGSGVCEAEYGSSGSSNSTKYTVAGTASFGNSGNCVAISLADTTANANDITTLQVGPGCNTPATFQFPVEIPAGDGWAVTIPSDQPIAAYCSLANATGQASANVTNVQVTCN